MNLNKIQQLQGLGQKGIKFIFTVFLVLVIGFSLLVNIITRFTTQTSTLHYALLFFAVFFLIRMIYFKNEGIWLGVIVAITAITRIIWIFSINVTPQSDFKTYHEVTQLILQNSVGGNTYIALFPHVIGLPAFLAPFYAIFGSTVLTAQLVNILLCCVITMFLYLIGKKFADGQSGLFISLIWALWPSRIFYTELVATEMLSTLSVLIFIYLILAVKDKPIYYYVFPGIILALANSVRPVAIILIIAVFLYMLLCHNQKFVIRILNYSVMMGSYFVLSFIIMVIISNAVGVKVAKNPIGFSTLAGSNVSSSGMWNVEDSEYFANLYSKEGISPDEAHKISADAAKERFKENGGENVWLLVKKFGIMWSTDYMCCFYLGDGLIAQGGSELPVRYKNICNAYYLMILTFCAIGMIRVIGSKSKDGIILIILFVLGTAAIHLVAEVMERYNYTALVLMLFICAMGSASFFAKSEIEEQRED